MLTSRLTEIAVTTIESDLSADKQISLVEFLFFQTWEIFKEEADNTVTFEHFPRLGISLCSFPFWNQKNFKSPMSMVKVKGLKYGTEVGVSHRLDI